MINSTCEGFAEYFKAIEIWKEFKKKEILQNLRMEYDEYVEIQLGRFTKWLKEAAKINRINVNERKSGKERFIQFGSPHPSPLPKGEGEIEKVDATFFDSEPK